MIRRLVLLSALASCGRLGFDASGDGGGSNVSPLHDGTVDTPSSTVCGDGSCVANLGETCVTCASDCKTTTPVCGNLACDPGEDGTTCPTDCGPVPWQWDAEEMDLLNLINNARTGGVQCPGTGAPMTAPALTITDTLHRAARDLAWEQAQYDTVGVKRCDGQNVLSYLATVNANNVREASGAGTTQQWISAWEADMNACPQLVDTSVTTIGVAVATGAKNTTYIVVTH